MYHTCLVFIKVWFSKHLEISSVQKFQLQAKKKKKCLEFTLERHLKDIDGSCLLSLSTFMKPFTDPVMLSNAKIGLSH